MLQMLDQMDPALQVKSPFKHPGRVSLPVSDQNASRLKRASLESTGSPDLFSDSVLAELSKVEKEYVAGERVPLQDCSNSSTPVRVGDDSPREPRSSSSDQVLMPSISESMLEQMMECDAPCFEEREEAAKSEGG
jgi:hypothetical protein